MNSELKFVETDSFKILDKIITDFEKEINEDLSFGDERRLFLHNQSQIIVSILNEMEKNYKQNFLKYATANKLDALGELMDCKRLEATKAISKVKFTISMKQSEDILIPKHTKLTPNGKIFFETDKDLIIKNGELTGVVKIIALEVGTNHNGFIPGTIKNLVDVMPYIESVSNIETSHGGTDEEADEHYRYRIKKAPNSFSVAGATTAYEYFVSSIDNTINDVKVISPNPGVVRIIILLKDGEIPKKELLDKVETFVNARDKRPLTDKVEVKAPEIENYDINFTYYILKEDILNENIIKENVNKAVKQFISMQESHLGKEINPDMLRKLVLNAGANRIVVTEPTFKKIDEHKVAKLNKSNFKVNYGGLD